MFYIIQIGIIISVVTGNRIDILGVAARKILERRRREEGWNSKEARRRDRGLEYGTRMRWVKAMKEFRKLREGSTEEELRRGFEL